VIHFDPLRRRIEQHGIATFEVRCADGNAQLAIVHTPEIDQSLKAFACWAEIVQTREGEGR
jgi:hypothetical protein